MFNQIKSWYLNADHYDNKLDRAYWKIWLWMHNEIHDPWNQFKFNLHERYKSLVFSIKVGSWHKPCIECWGTKTSVKYGQEQECRMGCGVGYQRTGFWNDMKSIFYPSQKIYNFKGWLRQVFLGCSKSDPHIWHEYCRYGTCGCGKHPLVNDWEGKPLTSKQ